MNGKLHNFNKYDSNTVTHFNLPYDYEVGSLVTIMILNEIIQSVMHYSKLAFSKNGKETIQTLDPTKQDTIGQMTGVRITI